MNLTKKPNSGIIKKYWLFFLPLFRLYDYLKLIKYLSSVKTRILHLHYALHSYMLIGIKKTIYIHVHGSDIRDISNTKILYKIAKSGLKRATKVFYTTPDLYQYLKDIRPDAIYLPNPIKQWFFDANIKQKNEFPKLDILCINKIDKHKGVRVCLNAIDSVWKQIPELKVGIFNFGNAMYLSEDFFKKHRENKNLFLIEKLPYEKMPHLINSAKIILGQMELGVLGCSELEAMASGKAVVSKFEYFNAYPEVPPLANAKNQEEAANKILKLLQDKQLIRDVGKSSREWALKYHSVDKIINKLLYYYLQDI